MINNSTMLLIVTLLFGQWPSFCLYWRELLSPLLNTLNVSVTWIQLDYEHLDKGSPIVTSFCLSANCNGVTCHTFSLIFSTIAVCMVLATYTVPCCPFLMSTPSWHTTYMLASNPLHMFTWSLSWCFWSSTTMPCICKTQALYCGFFILSVWLWPY